jgi:CheY-like chemotaxis protein
MNIAIIDDELIFHDIVGENIKDVCSDCNIDFFIDAADFGKANLKKFDVIISDNRLPGMSGRELLKSISLKTKATLILISAYEKDFIIENESDGHITSFVSKTDMSSLLDQIKYINSKLRINHLLDMEEAKIANLIKHNGCSVEINGSIMIIGLSNALTEDTRKDIYNKIKNSNYTGIVFFSEGSILGSILMKELVYFYKAFRDQNKKFCFWNAYKEEHIKKMLISCNIDKLFQIFDNIDEAMHFLLLDDK